MTLFGIGFAAPWLLLGLLALPILWIILRAVPPAPIRRIFPGVVLLLGLKDDEQVSDRTPWWLLLLRMLAVALVILGLAGPILNPQDRAQAQGNGPILVLLDASWASAPDWTVRMTGLEALLAEAARQNRTVGVLRATDPAPVTFQTADAVLQRLPGLAPRAWLPDETTADPIILALPDGQFDTYWMSDGLDRVTRVPLLDVLEDRGTVTVFESARPVYTLSPPVYEDGTITLGLARLRNGPETTVGLTGHGLDPAGNAAVLVRADATFAAGDLSTEVGLSLPAELRARMTRFEIDGQRSAGATTLSDDSLRRREVALIADLDGREGLELLSPLYYLDRALAPTADLLEGALTDVLPANPDVIVLADIATVTNTEQDALLDWLEKGGLLLRFAGPRLAASDVSRDDEDPLMPVRLRAGGRSVGGAMSWGEPKSLAPFGDDSPFAGLPVTDEVTVSAQVMAQPDPTLADRVIAQLSDGTPLVTRKSVGQGQIVLFHITANAEWSTLPFSGLFVQMLERLAVSTAPAQVSAEDLAGLTWQPQIVLDGFGRTMPADTLPGVPGEVMAEAPIGPDLRPGLYAGEDRTIARNAVTAQTELTPVTWPGRIRVEGLSRAEETPLAGWLLGGAILLLLADVIASLALAGRLRGARAAAAALALLSLSPQLADAQDAQAIQATSEVRLAHVLTGDRSIDDIALAGLRGLSETLFFRTSVEPGEPASVDLEADELAFFPMLYWPITPDQPTPSDAAYTKLNDYLRSGGMIVFDTRDADIARFGGGSPNGRKLRALAAPLNVPPLEPIPDDHVLTRTFYLLQDFPGRHTSRDVWVEAAPPDAERVEGMPFRNLNDNVTPVVIGGNDWAAAWARDAQGAPQVRLGRGFTGERQREIAYRFGVNLVMHVLTGNYKSDQVHVPALLDRLGQ